MDAGFTEYSTGSSQRQDIYSAQVNQLEAADYQAVIPPSPVISATTSAFIQFHRQGATLAFIWPRAFI